MQELCEMLFLSCSYEFTVMNYELLNTKIVITFYSIILWKI